MIILDTNVVSEPMKPTGNDQILKWLDKQLAETLFLTSTSLAELLVGIEILPDGKRKMGLDGALTQLVSRLFASRILAFDKAAAENYAPLISRTRSAGYSIAVADGQIAAIAATHGFAVATRDTAPFVAAGISTINPWKEG
ncbi:PIN domain-containing protein [Rhizobium sp. LEGMi135b]